MLKTSSVSQLFDAVKTPAKTHSVSALRTAPASSGLTSAKAARSRDSGFTRELTREADDRAQARESRGAERTDGPDTKAAQAAARPATPDKRAADSDRPKPSQPQDAKRAASRDDAGDRQKTQGTAEGIAQDIVEDAAAKASAALEAGADAAATPEAASIAGDGDAKTADKADKANDGTIAALDPALAAMAALAAAAPNGNDTAAAGQTDAEACTIAGTATSGALSAVGSAAADAGAPAGDIVETKLRPGPVPAASEGPIDPKAAEAARIESASPKEPATEQASITAGKTEGEPKAHHPAAETASKLADSLAGVAADPLRPDTASLAAQPGAPAQAAAHTTAAAPAAVPALHQAASLTPLGAVPITIGLKALEGSRRFEIKLDPEELGKIDVSLSIDDKGKVDARIVVDRVETLQLLQRDARTLERAFEQAGLDTGSSSIQFSLRSDGGGNRPGQDGTNQASRFDQTDEAPDGKDTMPVAYARTWRQGSGLDISI